METRLNLNEFIFGSEKGDKLYLSRFYANLTRTTFKELSFRMRQSTGTFPAR